MKKLLYIVLLLVAPFMMMGASSCATEAPTTTAGSITQASADISTGIDGLTAEQRNVKKRLEEDSKLRLTVTALSRGLQK